MSWDPMPRGVETITVDWDTVPESARLRIMAQISQGQESTFNVRDDSFNVRDDMAQASGESPKAAPLSLCFP